MPLPDMPAKVFAFLETLLPPATNWTENVRAGGKEEPNVLAVKSYTATVGKRKVEVAEVTEKGRKGEKTTSYYLKIDPAKNDGSLKLTVTEPCKKIFDAISAQHA